jgi:hypothetical protein
MEERHDIPAREHQQADIEDAVDGALKIYVPRAEVIPVRVGDSGGPRFGEAIVREREANIAPPMVPLIPGESLIYRLSGSRGRLRPGRVGGRSKRDKAGTQVKKGCPPKRPQTNREATPPL